MLRSSVVKGIGFLLAGLQLCGCGGNGRGDGGPGGADASARAPGGPGCTASCTGDDASPCTPSGQVRYGVGAADPGAGGGTVPFGAGDDGSKGTTVIGGALTLGTDPSAPGYPYIWIANSDEGTISKIDT